MAPTISASISSPDATTGWYNIASGPAVVTYTTADTGSSGLAQANPSSVTLGDGADQSVAAVTIYDVAGNSATAQSFSGINQDTVAPTISASISSPDATTGWYNIASGPAVVTYTTADTGSSGLAQANPSSVTLGDGADQSVAAVTIYDVAGNSATAQSFSGINQDTVAPTISASITSPDATTGWYNIASGAAVISFTASDTTSGVTAPANHTFANGAHQSFFTTVRDVAGNVSNSAGFSGISQDTVAPTVAVSTPADGATFTFGQLVAASYSYADSLSSISSHTGTVANGANIDTSTVGSHTFTVMATDVAGNTNSVTDTYSVTIATASVYLLGTGTNGALTISGNATINLPGNLVVDSSSSSAILASGNSKITAAGVQVGSGGSVSKSGNASVPSWTATAPVGDPLNLANVPNPGGTPQAVNVGGSTTMHLCPGLYSAINASGNAKLILASGIYYIQGGGFTVSGNASIDGSSGVLIYNTVNGSSNGGITLSGNGTFNLQPLSNSGQYAGIVIFQPKANTRALNISGNAMLGTTGIIYAPTALLTVSGNGQLGSTTNPISLVVNTLNVSGNVSLAETAAGSDGAGDVVGIADTLLAGDLNVYVDNSGGYFTADELARIQDAADSWDAVLAPYNVSINIVSDSASANFVLDANTASASGDMGDGVLGCFNPGNSEITMTEGWNWYAGADPSQIGSDQYDFETTVMHEFGHALGLGGSSSDTSPMNESLPTATARRVATTPDLNIPYPPDGADPLTAAGYAHASEDAVGPAGGRLAETDLAHAARQELAPVGAQAAVPTPGAVAVLAGLAGPRASALGAQAPTAPAVAGEPTALTAGQPLAPAAHGDNVLVLVSYATCLPETGAVSVATSSPTASGHIAPVQEAASEAKAADVHSRDQVFSEIGHGLMAFGPGESFRPATSRTATTRTCWLAARRAAGFWRRRPCWRQGAITGCGRPAVRRTAKRGRRTEPRAR